VGSWRLYNKLICHGFTRIDTDKFKKIEKKLGFRAGKLKGRKKLGAWSLELGAKN
jgi:hypothetical protein